MDGNTPLPDLTRAKRAGSKINKLKKKRLFWVYHPQVLWWDSVGNVFSHNKNQSDADSEIMPNVCQKIILIL